MFTESKADETFHLTYTYLYSMADRRDIDRTYKCLSEWRSFLVKSCICSFILSCFWQPYECVTVLSKVFWVVVSCYVYYSVCFQFLKKIQKLSFLHFFLGCFLLLWDRCGVVLRSSSVVWRSLWVVPGFSDYLSLHSADSFAAFSFQHSRVFASLFSLYFTDSFAAFSFW